MINFTSDFLQYIATETLSEQRKQLRDLDFRKYKFYNGATKEQILEAIHREFKRPETIEALSSRIIPLNICKKVIKKEAGIYIENPTRIVSNESDEDQELLDSLVDTTKLDGIQKQANRYLKLFKRNLKELFVSKGKPRVRNIPRHQYEVFSFSSDSPDEPDIVVKIVKETIDKKGCILDVWSNESYVRIDGEGNIDRSYMQSLNNPEMVNPYGELPFTYINESSDSVDPVGDDDLLAVSIAVPIVLTDLLFASKYQTFGILYTIGAVGDVPFNPNSVVNMQVDVNGNRPEIGVVKPSLDSEKVIDLVTNIVAMLLSSRGLSANTIKTTTNVSEVVSGVAKMLDSAENIEGRTDDMQLFLNEEGQIWHKLSKVLMPLWIESNLLDVDYSRNFSEDFGVTVQLRSPKAIISETEQIATAKAKIDAKLSTPEIELARIYPDASQEEIETIWEKIQDYNSTNEQSLERLNESTIQD
jgi:hypothetical protein